MTDRSAATDAAFAEDVRQGTDGGVPLAPPPLPSGTPLSVAAVLPMAAAVPLDPACATIETHEGEQDATWRDGWVQLPSYLASMVVHLALVLMLAVATTITIVRDSAPSLVVSSDGPAGDLEQPEELSADLKESATESENLDSLEPAPLAELPPTAAASGAIKPILGPGEPKLAGGEADAQDLMASAGGHGLELRLDGRLRSALVRSGGGSPQSEQAVLMALKWLAEHQEHDGSWSFQHHKNPKCNGQCKDPGFTPGKIASTSLALLPFLGTGQTQFEGEHKRTIDLGLKFLVREMKYEEKLGSLWDTNGTMYGHGLASIVLCEAYGMTRDPLLREPAQAAVNFIVHAQDPNGGGWRYHPQTPGDTSVVGWQLMALKSAQMAYLRVPHETLRKTGYFLDSVQSQKGAMYGYQRPDTRRPATSAIGLLCRMYLGWGRSSKPLERGVEILASIGPSTDKTPMRNNMYYNYYATQVMHHWGGYPWQRWNAVMRDYLIDTQSRKGHQYGSWYFDGADHGSGAGGRLYCTAMAAMTLEVYYRHMPLYRPQSVSD